MNTPHSPVPPQEDTPQQEHDMSKVQDSPEAAFSQSVKDEVDEIMKGSSSDSATQKENETLKAEIAALKDQLLRTMAEMENVRRRSEKQVEDTAKFAVTGFAKGLIEVLENLHRATDNVPEDKIEEHPLLQTLMEGVAMTKKELTSVFERNGIKRIEPAVGDAFDHNFHQAVAHIPSAELTPGSIAQVMQAGYLLHDRLLRPAMVGVAKEIAE